MEPGSTAICNIFSPSIGLLLLRLPVSCDIHQLIQVVESMVSEPIVIWKVSAHCGDRLSPYLIPMPQLNQPVPVHPRASLRARVMQGNSDSESLSPSSQPVFDVLAPDDHVRFFYEVRDILYSGMFAVGSISFLQ
jgi:hypothetical protein